MPYIAEEGKKPNDISTGDSPKFNENDPKPDPVDVHGRSNVPDDAPMNRKKRTISATQDSFHVEMMFVFDFTTYT